MAGDNRARLKELLEIFENVYKNESCKISSKALFERLFAKTGVENNRKSVYKDIAVLNSISYLNVTFDNKSKAYCIENNVKFSKEEAEIIENALKTAKFINLDDTDEIIEKLHMVSEIGNSTKSIIRSVSEDIVKVGNVDVSQNIRLISQAIHENKKIQFDYWNYNIKGEFVIKTKSCTVSPYIDVWFRDFYYLLANYKGKVISHYRIDRMKNITLTNEIRESVIYMEGCNSGFNVNEYMSKLVGMSSGKREKVKIIFDSGNVNEVIDYLGQKINMKDMGDDTFVLDDHVITNKKFIKWILSFGDGAVVEEPRRLRDEVISKMQNMRNKYGI